MEESSEAVENNSPEDLEKIEKLKKKLLKVMTKKYLKGIVAHNSSIDGTYINSDKKLRNPKKNKKNKGRKGYLLSVGTLPSKKVLRNIKKNRTKAEKIRNKWIEENLWKK